MKTRIATVILLLIVISGIARVSSSFLGWDRLKAEASDIIVVTIGEPTPPTPGFAVVNGPQFDFGITVLSVLKGTNTVHDARLRTDHDLRSREAYLVFGHYKNGIYNAHEEFKVVPLGKAYSQQMIAGKPLDEQVNILLQLAADRLNREIAQEQTEKARLETALKK